MTSSPAVFVTGAIGFPGTALVANLVRCERTVRALARAASDRTSLTLAQVSLGASDILDRDSLARGMAACSRTFHLAACARDGRAGAWCEPPR